MDKRVVPRRSVALRGLKSRGIHPVKIPGYYRASNYELGRDIMRLRYDQMYEVLRGMRDTLDEEIQGDAKRGYLKLVRELTNVRIYLNLVLMHIGRVFQICRPFMDHEFRREKKVEPVVRSGEQK